MQDFIWKVYFIPTLYLEVHTLWIIKTVLNIIHTYYYSLNNLSMVEPLLISDLGTLNNFYKKRVVAVTNYLFVFKGQPA